MHYSVHRFPHLQSRGRCLCGALTALDNLDWKAVPPLYPHHKCWTRRLVLLCLALLIALLVVLVSQVFGGERVISVSAGLRHSLVVTGEWYVLACVSGSEHNLAVDGKLKCQ